MDTECVPKDSSLYKITSYYEQTLKVQVKIVRMISSFQSLLLRQSSDNELPLLRKPPQCGQDATVPNHYIVISIWWEPPYSELRTLKSCPNGQNQHKFPSESGQSHARSTYWCKKFEQCLLFLKILAVSIYCKTFQGLVALKQH